MESCSQTHVAHLQVVLLVLCLIIMGGCIPTLSACQLSLSFNKKQKIFKTCRDLGVQKASLAWSLFPHNHTLEIAFAGRAVSPSGWVGWGINLGSNPVMKGANALVAFRAANGSNLLTYKLSDETYSGVLPSCSPIDLVIMDKAVEITGTDVKIFASFQLQPNQTVLNHIWNRGPGMDQFQPQAHDPIDIRGALRINMLQGTVLPITPPHEKLKYIHGIVNTLGWGFLLPVGALTARYFRQFELEAGTASWFYAHIILQSSGYVLGIMGWAIGMKLGSYSTEVAYPQHRCIGITIFTFGSISSAKTQQESQASDVLEYISSHTWLYNSVAGHHQQFRGFPHLEG
ncbi:hypothetical protein O6H91_11G102300 [Diphasiastrum complanatum]|uniref:Uncharacterized protein n=1 Tax=Diphasiastrum complanatum TaxID=34168 RepID=A0ACC2CC91_DIPCM|nr:hypothetical protein O6H91_11G102300 [Diphasiastrum complanatum]